MQTGQPAAFVLNDAELKEFAALPSLQAQIHWTQRKISTATWDVENLLFKSTAELSPAEFEHYYLAQSRLSYLQLLERVLQNTGRKRPSALVRYKLAPKEGNEKLTDAQRGGKLLFEHPQDAQAWEKFSQNYGPYAAAEALQVPYEVALQYGENAPELLGAQEGKRLRELDAQRCLDEVLPQITELETRLTSLRAQTPQNNDFYVNFYALHARLNIYKTLAARARVMINLNQ